MSTGTYNQGRFAVATGALDLSTADLRALLVSSGYTFSAAHTFNNISNELAGAGYTRKVLANVLLVNDTVNSIVTLFCDSFVWPGANYGTPDALILFKNAVSDVDKVLIASLDLNPKSATSGGTHTVTVGPSGILILA